MVGVVVVVVGGGVDVSGGVVGAAGWQLESTTHSYPQLSPEQYHLGF